jgi:MipA family protein
MKKLLLTTLLASLSAPSIAQSSGAEPSGPPRWSLGVGGIATTSPYAGEGTKFTPIPLVNYEGDRFFWRTTRAGVHLMKRENFEVSALVGMRMDGFDIDDLGSTELRRQGLDPARLEDRDNGVDAGLAAKWSSRYGDLDMEILSDISGTSKGQSISLEYGYPLNWGKFRITPSVGASWLSKDMANYYYGILDKEVGRGVTDYKPGSAVIPRLGLSVMRPLGDKWAMFGSVQYHMLPSKIEDSPLIDRDESSSTSFMLGVVRSF